jgi:ClpP class serine protease
MMSHELRRLSKSLLEKPQLITQTKFEEIEAFLNARNEGLINQEVKLEKDCPYEEDCELSSDLVQGNIGYLKVEGALSYKLTGMEALCGGCSYTGLLADTDKLIAHGVKGIVMKVNSGGGEAYRCFETSRSIRKKCDEAGIKLIGYIDGSACSAAYGLVSACDSIVINPDAEAGSIGVVIRLQNQNEAMKKAGVKTKYITAGDSKVPFDEEGEFREDFIADLQNRVYELYDNFVSHVVSMRGGKISNETVRGTEARVFSAGEARAKGLVDEIMEETTFETFLKETYNLSSKTDEENKPKYKGDNLMSNATPQLSAEEVQALQAKLAGMEEMQAKLAKFEAKEAAEKTASLTALVTGAKLTNAEAIVEAMLSDAGTKTLMAGVIEDISAIQASHAEAITSLKTTHTEAIATLEATHDAALEEAKQEATQAKADSEKAKASFAESKAIEGDNTSIEDTEEKQASKSAALADFIKQKHNI